MVSNVVYLPRPPRAGSGPDPLALFIRAGRNDHGELLDPVATGERGISGLDGAVQKSMARKQEEMSRFRQVMAHLAAAPPSRSVAIPPPRRSTVDHRGR